MKFNYKARTLKGEIQLGTVEAAERAKAIEILQRNGLIILSIEEKFSLPFYLKDIKFSTGIGAKDMVVFCRQLSILFSAKIPLVESLRTTAKQTDNDQFRDILSRVAKDVEGGLLLSKALEKYPRIFSVFFINMIKSGEASGQLEDVLNYLAEYLEKQYYLNSRVKGAMVYPAFILVGFIIVSIIVLTTVIPQLTSILSETSQKLPWTTNMIIGVSGWLVNYGWMLGISALLIIGSCVYYVRNYLDGQRFWDNLKIKTPIIGPIFQKLYLSRLSDSLGTLIGGGIPILQALQVTADVMDNMILKEIILEAMEQVRVGDTMSLVFGKHKEIPPMVTNMLAVGEQTGTMDNVLKKLSSFYSKEVDNTVGNLSQLIEPILIVFLGIGVAILLAGVFMPIYNLAGSF